MKATVFSTLLIGGLLASCGNLQLPPSLSPGPKPTPGPVVSKVGNVVLVRTDSSTPSTAVDLAGASFAAVPAAAPTTSFDTLADTCVVSRSDTGIAALILPSAPAAPLDAGPALDLKASGKSVGTLTPLNPGQVGVYQSNLLFLDEPAQPFTVTVPGASGGFPAVADAAFPAAPRPLTLSAPADRQVTPNTVFTWPDPTNDAKTLVAWYVPAASGASLSCFARDDGSFSLPDQTRVELAAAGFTQGELVVTGRGTVQTQLQEDAALNTYSWNFALAGVR